ncbi:cytochrome d ubiquinol oxidase subunit II [Natrialbaceae archaeon AArc-T1-2]|uniref:cytochrome d ubiquinol oxidase subunit II n=1 Tax=Natrialbaceae archaeon AArc-T1-2 TaxID=3053904 RepID=UPI00255B037F|nr:cytochrome d ubiquinol oxidase subunit II [Natrialbaceae archaeon AArc-T1-2]WIV65671.1 cytochrome d ubiquinol oxidase subunit II [Natrialbaceae archaeon AArc-T1-2]
MTDLLSDSEYIVDVLPELWFGLVIFALGGYLLLDGFDFGLGILYADADDEERETMLAAFGPLWKANEVWLVLFGTVLFAAFPRVYANLLSRHYLLAFAIVFALSIRGLGSKLREEKDDETWVRFWDACFVAGSAFSPLLLGMFAASWVLGEPSALAPAPIVVGLTLVALSVVLGAAFLGVKTEGQLRETAARRGRIATGVYLALFVLTAAALYTLYPDLRPVVASAPTLLVVAVTVAAAAAFVYASLWERYRLAVGSAGLVAAAFVAFIAYLLYPSVDPAAELTIADAVVSPLALNVTSIFAAIFIPLILGYFVTLYSVFSGPPRESDHYG